MARNAKTGLTYAAAGVQLEAKDRFTESLTSIMRRTHGPRVIPNPGGFAGLFRLDYNSRLFARNYKDPVLVACADGVGTKLKLAAAINKFDTLGIDLVAMNVNDMIVQGAEPLFFLDYIAVPKVDSAMLTDIVKGIADGCRQAGCALLGGETAEMPDVYAPGEFDLAGFAVGVVELSRAVSAERVEKGDVVLGLSSSGIHSNGYSLVRRIVERAGLDLHGVYDDFAPASRSPGNKAASGKAGRKPHAAAPPLGEVLLTPTRIYVDPIVKLLRAYRVKKVITGMAHITGSGMEGNLCRALHKKVDAVVRRGSWPIPPVFSFLQKHGDVDTEEMYRVFNMGIGYCVIVRPAFADSIKERLEKLGESVHIIGEIVKGKGDVRWG
ncbi:MAG: phosphoribosylformylglycinamidine cyclo-ligase [Phycisphaeraceae bacterium]|nr:phosphoribosylformylglycinamidine cyclo-ligase [Phycisphaeraceae bacterium]MBX3408102.1 phosphoribosylformylglycinamidine cyclo-ligase [Phycisphaeraceae bacterium]